MKIITRGNPPHVHATLVSVTCNVIALRANVPEKFAPKAIPFVPHNTVREKITTKGSLVAEQHSKDGRYAEIDFAGLFSAGFQVVSVKQMTTTKKGMVAVTFRLERHGAECIDNPVAMSFLEKLLASHWTDAQIFCNPEVRNDAGDVVTEKNFTVNVLNGAKKSPSTQMFKLVSAEQATRFVQASEQVRSKPPVAKKEDAPFSGSQIALALERARQALAA